MLERLQYINHVNETLDFGEGGLFVNMNDLRDYTWTVSSKNERIAGFKKGIVTKTIPIILKCKTESEGLQMKNKLFEVFEKDVLAVKHGKFVIGEYFLKCFVIESKKTEYLLDKSYLKITVKISTDFPYWVREKSSTFRYGLGTEGKNLDFNRDYPSDYTSNLIQKKLDNTHFVPVNFRLVVYGICENPVVTIAGHPYKVNVTVEANEYLTIDSVNKTVTLTRADGTHTNCFNLRNRNDYIFKKIPVGSLNVSASGDFSFDVVLLEERGEPKWI